MSKFILNKKGTSSQRKPTISRLLCLTTLAAGCVFAPISGRSEEFQPLMMQTGVPLAIGKTMPEVQARNEKGEKVDVVDGQAKWTIVAFLSTRCPCTARYLTRLQEVEKEFSAQSVRLVGINSNANEQAKDAVLFAQSQKLTFAFLRDTDYSVIHALRARATPEVFVLDANRIVRYHGAIDDSLYGDNVKHFYLRDALTALTAGKPVPKDNVPTIGCGIFVPKK